MKITPYLHLQYGGLTYDGGAEKVANRNLDKIEAELIRLSNLAGISPNFKFTRGPFTWDGGQEVAAKSNLVLIEQVVRNLWASASGQSNLVLDTKTSALDGGDGKAMGQNLLNIDAELESLSDALDQGGGGDPEPPVNPGTGDWTAGDGSVSIIVGEKHLELPGSLGYNSLGYSFAGVEEYDVGSAINSEIGDARLMSCDVRQYDVDEEDPLSGKLVLRLFFINTTSFQPLSEMADRTLRLWSGNSLFWEGKVDGRDDTAGPEDDPILGQAVVELESVPNWSVGDPLVLEILGPG